MKLIKTFLALSALLLSQAALALAPLDAVRDSRNRIQDTSGRALYIIDFRDTALTGYSDQIDSALRARFHARHSGKAINFLTAFAQLHGFEISDMTSRIGLSVGAYLTPLQLAAVRNSPLVTLVSEATRWEFSAQTYPPFAERTLADETYSHDRLFALKDGSAHNSAHY